MAIEPRAVTIQNKREIAPTCAIFVGSMMIPEPIMFTATMNVSCIRLIFLGSCMTYPPIPTCAARLGLRRTTGAFRDTVDQITPPAARPLEAQAVDVCLEAGKLLIKLARIQQVIVNRLGGLGD